MSFSSGGSGPHFTMSPGLHSVEILSHFWSLQDWVINDYWSFTNEKAEMQDLLIIWDKDLEEEVKRCKTGSKLRSDLIHIYV